MPSSGKGILSWERGGIYRGRVCFPDIFYKEVATITGRKFNAARQLRNMASALIVTHLTLRLARKETNEAGCSVESNRWTHFIMTEVTHHLKQQFTPKYRAEYEIKTLRVHELCSLPASSFDPPSPLTRTEGTRVPSGWSAVSDSSDDVTPSLFRFITTGFV